ncbi:MAG TPA: hypothetical protein VML55_24115, partial [Planctomycetaceae bacterium]|nr:hypothetical protein [Planctomycetaceae bacterium]
RAYQYVGGANRTKGGQSASGSFALAAGNTNPQGIADPPVAADSDDGEISSVSAGIAVPSPHAISTVSLSLPARTDQSLPTRTDHVQPADPVVVLRDSARVRAVAGLRSETVAAHREPDDHPESQSAVVDPPALDLLFSDFGNFGNSLLDGLWEL